MRTVGICILTCAACVWVLDPTTDQTRIQGSWRVVMSQFNGKPHSDTMKARFLFKDNQLTITLFDGEKEETKKPIRFKLDATKSPKWIDLGPELGIYSIEEDELTICYGDSRVEGRMKSFESVAKSSAYLYKLKREK